MKSRWLLFSLASLLALNSAAQAMTYLSSESFDGATVDLSITTDGALGALSTGDITSWDISITDPAGSVDMTPLNSQVLVSGSAFVATATQLLFSFSSSLDFSGLVLFEMTTIGDSGPFWCATNGGCYGETVPAIGVSTQWGENPIEQTGIVGQTVIATAGVVPEPSTWAMIMLGFAGLGFAAYGRGKKMAPAAA